MRVGVRQRPGGKGRCRIPDEIVQALRRMKRRPLLALRGRPGIALLACAHASLLQTSMTKHRFSGFLPLFTDEARHQKNLGASVNRHILQVSLWIDVSETHPDHCCVALV